MHGLALLFSLHFGAGREGGDRWFGADKAKHFFTAAMVQSVSFSALRGAGLSRTGSLVGATLLSSTVSVGKEVYDLRYGGDPSVKDLAWDAAGIMASSVLLAHTAP